MLLELETPTQQATANKLLEARRFVFDLRMELIRRLHELQFELYTKCHACDAWFSSYNAIQQLKEKKNHAKNFVECRECGEKIHPFLVYRSRSVKGNCYLGSVEQLGKNLEQLADRSPKDIKDHHTAVFLAALIYYGGDLGYAAAACPAKVTYVDNTVIPDWREKVLPFLGKMPDKMIALAVRVSRTDFGGYRGSQKIQPFSWSKLAETMQQQ